MAGLRCIAVDWSGALHGARKRIALAEARGGRLMRVESGRDRDEIVQHLIGCAAERDPLAVGLDFAFSLPRWFLDDQALGSARALWDRCRERGESWLSECAPPFWGRARIVRPLEASGERAWRRAEREAGATGGISAKSTFQIGGAGAVGTGSLRGMPHLAKLQDAWFSIWPFDAARPPLVLEIYPRLLTGPVRKSAAQERARYLAERFGDQPQDLLAHAAASEDAFDAAVSALVMTRHAAELLALPPARDELDRLEGRIWAPGLGRTRAGPIVAGGSRS